LQELDASKRIVSEHNEEKKRFQLKISELEESKQQVEQEKRIVVQVEHSIIFLSGKTQVEYCLSSSYCFVLRDQWQLVTLLNQSLISISVALILFYC